MQIKMLLKNVIVGLFALISIISGAAHATAALPTTGTCGFVGGFNYPFVYMYGGNPGAGWGVNFFGTLNFSNNTYSINILMLNPGVQGSTQPTENQTVVSGTFTVNAGPVPGSYAVSMPNFASSTGAPYVFNLLPVNNGNTILMQFWNPNSGGQDGGQVGVCQM